MSFIKVKVTRDNDGHWFIIPNEIVNQFNRDLEDEDFVDSGKFDEIYGKYRTGGDINLKQLWMKIESNKKIK